MAVSQFLVVFEGSSFSGCPNQDERIFGSTQYKHDSVHKSILKCCNSFFLRHLFLGCTGLWFMAAGENESYFQHLAFGGLRNSCDSQRGFS